MKHGLKVLHSTLEYLPISSNWLYRLIKNVPEVENIIFAKRFLKNNFFDKDFRFIEFPIKELEAVNKTFKIKAANRIIRKINRLLLNKYVYFILKNDSLNIDIVHSHFGYIGYNTLTLAKKLKKPHIVSFYGEDYLRYPKYWGWLGKYKKLFKEANLFIVEGSYSSKILKELGCNEEKIIINRLGVEIDNVPLFKREKNKNELKLLQIAYFREKKGHIFTIKSFAKALRECPNMSLTFVGKGKEREKIIKFVEEQKLENHVKFVDEIVGLQNLYTFMKNYHVFIHPSCFASDMDCEGGPPAVILDAQATGLPVISTYHCDIPEAVNHEKTGFLAPEKDIDTLAKYIKVFYEMDNETYKRFSIEARKHIESFYNIKENAKKLREIYERIT